MSTLAPKKRSAFKTLKAVARLIWPEVDKYVKVRMLATLVLVFSASALAVLTPVVMKFIIDGLDTGEWPTATLPFINSASPSDIWVLGPMLLVAAYIGSRWVGRFFGELRGLVYGTADARLNRRLSRKLFAHIIRLPLRFHLDRKSGALNQTLVQGLSGYRIVMQHTVFTLLPVVTQLVIICAVLFYMEPTFLLILAVTAMAYTLAFTRGAIQISGPSREVSATTVESHGVLTDSLLNYETIKYFTGERAIQNRYNGALEKTENQWGIFFRRKLRNGTLLATIFCASLGTSTWLAADQVLQGALTVGGFVLINTYMMQIIQPLEQLGLAFRDLAQGIAFVEKMMDIFDQKTEPSRSLARPSPAKPGVTSTCGELTFNNVSFQYNRDRKILKNISFTVPAGKTTAIVGPSGSGKSSLVRLLVRLYDVNEGEISLNGTPINTLPLTELRQAIAVVPQDTVLFNDTLSYNIAFSRPDSNQQEIEHAARLAHIHHFIDLLPDKYLTTVGERGLKLSGGEKQRIAIARAVLNRPQVYVFDEATSSLDTQTEQEILKNMIEVSQGVTSLVIAHRLSTVIHAEEILVLDKGEIVERGSHKELLIKNGRYASMWHTQQKAQVKEAV